MNIDQYRAMKAQEEAATKEVPQTIEPVVEAPVVPETPVVETPPAEPETPPSVEKIVVDGEELTVEQIKELRAAGLRTQDYTQKTQEIARIRRESAEAIELYEYLKSNPVVADKLLSDEQLTPDDKQRLAKLDPRVAHNAKIERELNDLKLQREIDTLSAKYSDFDVVKVLHTAYEKQMTNLEDAYKLTRADAPAPELQTKTETQSAPTIDLEAERAKLRDEILAELRAEGNATKTIISSNGGTPPKQETAIQLTPEQDRVRKMQGLSVEDYQKWMVKR